MNKFVPEPISLSLPSVLKYNWLMCGFRVVMPPFPHGLVLLLWQTIYSSEWISCHHVIVYTCYKNLDTDGRLFSLKSKTVRL